MRRCHRFLLAVAGLLVLAPLPLPAQNDEKKPQDDKQPFKRRDSASAEELRKQLLLVPEVGFDQGGAALLLSAIQTPNAVPRKLGKTALPAGAATVDIGPRFYAQLAQQYKKPDWTALPWRMGVESQLGKEVAEGLHVYSVNLRAGLRGSVPPNDVRPDVDKLKGFLATGSALRPGIGARFAPAAGGAKPLAWDKAACVPTVAQMMQTENTPLRLLMVDMLAKVEGKEAGVVLAQRALFDLAPEVRAQAVAALAGRPVNDYMQALVDGLRWPWQPAADHAAEALAALRLKEAAPALTALLKEPDPKLPFTRDGMPDKGTYVREMVRINHLSNCLLCHAPSHARDDLVRGRIPIPGEDPPPQYYSEATGQFVRADTTFLRQDFSLVQPVANPGKWQSQQRFDYLLRTRKATPKEIALLKGLQQDNKLLDPYPQREAVLFALRGITNTNAELRSDDSLFEKKLAPKEGK